MVLRKKDIISSGETLIESWIKLYKAKVRKIYSSENMFNVKKKANDFERA
jgi:hypothetical protein